MFIKSSFVIILANSKKLQQNKETIMADLANPVGTMVREGNCTAAVVACLIDLEQSGCLGKIVTYAISFFLMIGLCITVVGIPLFLMGVYEYAQQNLARDHACPQGGAPAQPDPQAIQAAVTHATQQIQAQLTQATQDLAARRQERDDALQLSTQAQQTVQNIQARLDALQTDRDQVEGQRAAAAQEVQTLNGQIQTLTKQLQDGDQTGVVATLRQDLQRAAQDLQAKTQEFDRRGTDIENLNGELGTTKQARDAQIKEVERLTPLLNTANDELRRVQQEFQRVDGELTALKTRAQQDTQKLQKTADDATRAAEQANKDKDDQVKLVATKEDLLVTARATISSLEAQLASSASTDETVRQLHDTLRKKGEELTQAADNLNRVQQALTTKTEEHRVAAAALVQKTADHAALVQEATQLRTDLQDARHDATEKQKAIDTSVQLLRKETQQWEARIAAGEQTIGELRQKLKDDVEAERQKGVQAADKLRALENSMAMLAGTAGTADASIQGLTTAFKTTKEALDKARSEIQQLKRVEGELSRAEKALDELRKSSTSQAATDKAEIARLNQALGAFSPDKVEKERQEMAAKVLAAEQRAAQLDAQLRQQLSANQNQGRRITWLTSFADGAAFMAAKNSNFVQPAPAKAAVPAS
jgi:chromosome segregation ATPase